MDVSGTSYVEYIAVGRYTHMLNGIESFDRFKWKIEYTFIKMNYYGVLILIN